MLLEVQWAIIEEHCGNEADFNAEEINRLYARELAAAYNRYLQDMVTNWMLNRQGWVSGSDGHQLTKAELGKLSKEFKESIQDKMQSELKEFHKFQVKSFKEVGKLRPLLEKRKAQQSAKAEDYKKIWDKASFRLADLAAQCNELRALRSKVQTQIDDDDCNLETFNTAITALFKMTGGDLAEFTTVDTAGFNLFQYACWGGNLTLVQGLLARGVKAFALTDVEGNYAIHLAVENESQVTPELLETLSKQPLPDKITNILELKNRRNKKTLLHVAATFGNLTAVQLIVGKLQAGKKLNLLDLEVEADGRMTPLHYAAREGQEGVVNFLLTFGAGRSVRFADNNHPLILAIQHKRLGVVGLFAQRGIGLDSEQIEHLYKMANQSDASLFNIAHCLAIPALQALNNLSGVPGLAAANNRSMTASTSIPVRVSGDHNVSSAPSQLIVAPLDVSVLAAAFEEPPAKQVEQTEQPGQDLFFDTRGRAVADAALMPAATDNVTPIANTTQVDAGATPATARTTATATL